MHNCIQAAVQKAAESVVTRQKVRKDMERTEGTKRLVCHVVYPEEKTTAEDEVSA